MTIEPNQTLRLIAAPFTAFAPDGSVDLAPVEHQARSLRADGVAGAFICGTTGEGASMTVAERRLVAEAWVAAPDGVDLIVHVGHASLPDAQELAAHADGLGVAAIAAVAPYYHLPVTVHDLVEVVAEIAAAAPHTPFFYYHIPSMSGVRQPMDEFLVLAAEQVPTFRGIKYTHDDLGELTRCQAVATPATDILFGRDELLLPALVLGARSAVGSTYNFAAPIYQQIGEALADSDLARARRLQGAACDMIDIAIRHGGHAALKALNAMVAVDCGPCRRPIRTLTESERTAMSDELKHVGFYEVLDAARSGRS